MKFFALIPYYFAWHYTTALVNFFRLWGTFIWFLYTYFSFHVLLRTLFAPYKRLTEKYRGGLDIENWFESVIVNTLMRIVGLFLRIIVLIIGAIAVTGIVVGGGVAFLIWLVLPIVLAFLFVSGLIAVVTSL